MAKRTRIPSLNKAEFEAFALRMQQSGVSANQQKTILASLSVASNPKAETPEYGFATLPPSRQVLARQSIQATGAIFSDVSNGVMIDLAAQQDLNEALIDAQTESKDRIDWSIVLALLAFFLFPREQQKSLYDAILSAYVSAWQLAIREQATKYGCPNASIGKPSGASLSQMKEWAKRDSESIAKTYDENAQSALRKLYDANPLGTVAYYLNGMSEWANSRALQKNLTIGINNVQAGYQLGLQDFHVGNDLQTQYRFTGSPPVCPICSRLMGMGAVDFATMVSNPAPAHINCPHYWQPTKVYRIDCSQIWTG